MVNTMIAPVALSYRDGLAASLLTLEQLGVAADETTVLFTDVSAKTEALLAASRQLSAAIESGTSADKLSALSDARECVDALEAVLPSDEWPLPSYTDLLFMM